MSQTSNFQVFQASAGSGKTFTIVKEYLKLCLKSERHVGNFKHILAITFTNASANDMKAKIMKQLREIIDGKVLEANTMEAVLLEELGISDAELKRNAQSLMTAIIHDYSSFCVCTIDAFVQKLSRTFANDMGLPSKYSVSIDEEEVADTITQQVGAQIADDNPFLVQLLMDFSENRFAYQKSNNLEYQLRDFVRKLMSEKAYANDGHNSIVNLPQYRQTLGFLNDRIKAFEQQIEVFVKDFDAIRKRYGIGMEDFAYGKAGFASYVEKLSKKVYEAPTPRFKAVAETGKWYSAAAKKRFQTADLELVAADIQPILNSILACCESHLGGFLFYKSQRDLLYLYALRSLVRSEFKRLAADEEVVHITEFNKLLNRLLGDFSVPFVYERIGERFNHVFVDEFQDTSVLQWQNLIPLIDNGLSMGSMSMVVGDGKQSIYRFRSGEVEQIVQLPEIYELPSDARASAFLQYQHNLEDNFAFHNLDSNFRSFEQVVLFNNSFFAQACQQLSEPLRKVYQAENDKFGKKVSISQRPRKKEKGLVQVEMYDAVNRPDYCLERIEALIHELTKNQGYRFSDITILVRNSKLGSKIANYLNVREIPVISQDSILLKSSDKVQLIVHTLRYLIHADNEAYIANVLYYNNLVAETPFDGHMETLFDKVKGIAQSVVPIEPVLGIGEAGLLDKILSKSTCLYDLCSSLIRVYHIETLYDAFLDYFLEETFAYQSAPKESISDFLTFWDRKQGSLSVKSVAGNAVNIKTIHKSKGLEFNVVIYPDAITDLDEKPRSGSVAEEWISPEELGFEPIPNLGKVLFKLDKAAELMGDTALQHVENEKESNKLDNLNLLYVAFTRAVQRLYVIAKVGKPDKPNIVRDFLSDKDINKVWEADGCVRYCFGDPDFRNPETVEENQCVESDVTHSDTVDWFHRIKIESSPSMFWISPDDRMAPREWGDFVHQILSGIQSEDDIESALEPHLLDGTINKETADLLQDKFKQMARHPMIAQAFGKAAKVKNECEILSNGEILRPDRYAELPDTIYLLDYKTGKKEEEHHEQLKRYIGALQGMVEKEIRAFLVYLADSLEVEPVLMDTLF